MRHVNMYNSTMSPEHTLSDLSEITGEPIRRIRSYIQQDLLPRPTTAGRNASYPDRSLNRLLAIKHLRDIEGLSVDEVRQTLASLGEQEISDIAKASSDGSLITVETSYRRSTGRGGDSENSRAGAALRYIKNLKRGSDDEQPTAASRHRIEPSRSQSVAARQNRSQENQTSVDPTDVDTSTRFRMANTGPPSSPESSQQRQISSDSALRKLLARLNEVAPSVRIKRRARSEEWIKIPITPDMELHVRKEFGDHDQAALEILADYIREAMAGGI